MQVQSIGLENLRRLADFHPARGKIVSLYLNLDPREFATPAARKSEIQSLLDQADRMMREMELESEERSLLEGDLNRLTEYFSSAEFDAKGAHALAIFIAHQELFEIYKLPAPVDSQFYINSAAHIEPLIEFYTKGEWWIALVNRRRARIFRGSSELIRQVATVEDEVHGQHQQGGWSQARYERGIRKEAQDHFKHVADELFARHKRNPFEHLIIGTHEELKPQIEHWLHPYLKDKLTGFIDIDVDNTPTDEVLNLVRPLMHQEEQKVQKEMLERLAAGLATEGRACAGIKAVLRAINERRVEVLLIGENYTTEGVKCPECGWLGTGKEVCPADGTQVERVEDMVEEAVERTITQSARPWRFKSFNAEAPENLKEQEGIAALLRF